MAEITLTMQLSPGFTVHISDNIALDEPEKAKELLTEFCAILQEYGTDLILDARETINIVSRQAMEQVRPPERVLQEQARQAHEKEYEANQNDPLSLSLSLSLSSYWTIFNIYNIH